MSLQENLLGAYWQVPPLTRTLVTVTVALSVPVNLGLLSVRYFYHDARFLLQLPPHIWRPVTAFFITGPQLSLIFEPYFLYRYMLQMETGNPRFSRREDVLWYLIFVGSIILVIDQAFGLGFPFFLRALNLALCYTVTQDQRGMQAGFFFFTIPAQLTPICTIAVSFLLAGPMAALLEVIGLVAAHLYDFLSRLWPEFGGGVNLIPTPAVMSRLVRTPRVVQRAAGTAIHARDESSSGRTTGASSGPLPDSWRTRGRGQRLG